MTDLEAEFDLRSLVIEALATCEEAGFEMATITVIPASGDDGDWWKVSYEKDGETYVTTCYAEGA